mgnify:CR=1 FL=1
MEPEWPSVRPLLLANLRSNRIANGKGNPRSAQQNNHLPDKPQDKSQGKLPSVLPRKLPVRLLGKPLGRLPAGYRANSLPKPSLL